jgi:hypothetical protein
LGKLRNLKVWPVGAVSKMITSKSIFSIVLDRTGYTRSAGQMTWPRQYQELN